MSEPTNRRKGRERAQQKKDTHATHGEAQNEEGQIGAPSLQPLIDQIVAYREEQDASETKKLTLERLTVFLLAVTVALTFATFLIVKGQLDVAHNAVIQAHSDEVAAISAAGAAATGALQEAERESRGALGRADTANDTSRDTANRQLRAYVHVEVADFSGAAPGQVMKASVITRAIGQTPAYDVSIVSEGDVLPNPLTHPLRDPAAPRGMKLSQALLHPGTQMTQNFVFDGPLDAGIAQSIGADKLHVYIWGVVKYKDTFGTEHFTSFCDEFGGAAGGAGITCLAGNEAD